MKLIKGAVVRLTATAIKYVVRTKNGNYINWSTANTFPFQFRILSVEDSPYTTQKIARIELVNTPLVARRKYNIATRYAIIRERDVEEILFCSSILTSRRTKPSTINL